MENFFLGTLSKYLMFLREPFFFFFWLINSIATMGESGFIS